MLQLPTKLKKETFSFEFDNLLKLFAWYYFFSRPMIKHPYQGTKYLGKR